MRAAYPPVSSYCALVMATREKSPDDANNDMPSQAVTVGSCTGDTGTQSQGAEAQQSVHGQAMRLAGLCIQVNTARR